MFQSPPTSCDFNSRWFFVPFNVPFQHVSRSPAQLIQSKAARWFQIKPVKLKFTSMIHMELSRIFAASKKAGSCSFPVVCIQLYNPISRFFFRSQQHLHHILKPLHRTHPAARQGSNHRLAGDVHRLQVATAEPGAILRHTSCGRSNAMRTARDAETRQKQVRT